MNILPKKNPVDHLLIYNTFTDEELRLIWQELDFLTHPNKLKNPKDTKSAIDNGEVIKKNRGIFLDELYADRNISNILTINRKLLTWEIFKNLSNENFIISETLKNINHDTTLISYYEDNHEYKFHHDTSFITIVSYFYKEPKAFSGGNFFLLNDNSKIDIFNNMSIVFFSAIPHAVEKVSIEYQLKSGYGRYCMSQFLHIIPT